MPASVNHTTDTLSLIESIFKAYHSGNMQEVQRLLALSPDLPSISSALTEKNWAEYLGKEKQRLEDVERAEQKKKEEAQRQRNSTRSLRTTIGLLSVLLALFIIIGLLGWGTALGFVPPINPTPTIDIAPTLQAMAGSTATAQLGGYLATGEAATATAIWLTPTVTPTLTPTPTPIPASVFEESENVLVVPPPLPYAQIYRISPDAAVANPLITDTATWKPQEIGGVKFYSSSVGNLQVSWEMDQVLPEGWYAIYILDTNGYSAGQQIFSVLADGMQISPLLGNATVTYQFSKSMPPQKEHVWQPLGIYAIQTGQKLSVGAAISELTEETAFGFSDLLILRLSDDQRTVFGALLGERPVFTYADDTTAIYQIITDEGAVYSANDSAAWLRQTDSPTVGASFVTRNQSDPQLLCTVDWQFPGTYSPGTYEIRVWIPALHATAGVEYVFLVDGSPVGEPRPLNQADHAGEWVSMSNWTLETESAIALRMIVPPGLQGEVAADAVALLITEQ